MFFLAWFIFYAWHPHHVKLGAQILLKCRLTPAELSIPDPVAVSNSTSPSLTMMVGNVSHAKVGGTVGHRVRDPELKAPPIS